MSPSDRRKALSALLHRHGFMIGLIGVTALTVVDDAEISVRWGLWLKAHHGPDAIIAAIFFVSGLTLKKETLWQGLMDLKAIGGALFLIFILAPLWALALAQWPMGPGLVAGLFLVASMPTTLSSGVVMTGSAGGNTATALLITIVSNVASVVVTPLLLEFLLGQTMESTTVVLDTRALMVTLTFLVLTPLALGMSLRRPFLSLMEGTRCPHPGTLNTFLVIMIVWLGVCGSRHTILRGLNLMPLVLALAVVLHGGLLAGGFLMARSLGLSVGRREAVIFMGGQKTLPLSVLIQTAIFPQYGEALVFCVGHHLVHLIMDGGVLSLLKTAQSPSAHGMPQSAQWAVHEACDPVVKAQRDGKGLP
ncbi:MAG: bile acid:sodium symporter [Desulfosoma sp.]|uniref:bile acid:sodium symporter n=1 Tax=Desulfosoma sp. TaxID=2603217 RepID=UPI0040494EAE